MSRRTNNRHAAMLLLLAALAASVSAQTPVIGGACKVGTADVQIGGKQTQFFLKCEATAESTNGEGVWVVKSRSAASSPSAAAPATTALPAENTQPQRQMFKYNPNICEQDNNAREGDSCGVSPTCLQANLDNPTTFLQCEQSSARWIKKSCQDTYIFNFEQQACIVPKRNPNTLHRQQTGLVCTYSSCSNSNPCSSGTCNNGYCCSSSGNTGTQIIHVCAGGFESPIACGAGLEACPLGLHCDELLHVCCPLLLPLIDSRNPQTSHQFALPAHLASRTVHVISRPAFRIEPDSGPIRMHSLSRKPSSFAQPSTSSCNGCAQQAPQIITIPSACTAGCPRGYSGCCGTSRASCCLKQQCPQGMQSTGQRCAPDCPQRGQLCVAGICCSPSSLSPSTTTTITSSCPGGSQSYGSCASTGFCATGYQCIQGSCCPSYSQPSVTVYTCPGGGSAVGTCINGGCATGYTCSSNNQCCPTTNPFVCSDGTQAAGGCVNGQCGTGYTCSNGLCCASTSSSPKCLDGSPAVGACIPSCQGNACGGSTLTYYCGSGYTCTTGNICCPTTSCPDGGEPIGPTVNGLCPTGYSAQGTQCCSIVATCLDGEENIGLPVNNLCPTGATLRGTACCLATTTLTFAATCTTTVQLGPCTSTQAAGDTCGGQLGYACRADADGVTDAIPLVCCPLVDYTVCCSDTSLTMSRLKNHVVKPPRSIFSSRPHVAASCPSGDEPISACINGLCGAGLECHGKICCPAGLNPKFGGSAERSLLSSSSSFGGAIDRPKRLCPNGEEALSSCFPDGSCGDDLLCLGGVCCGTPSMHFSQSRATSKTVIGASCTASQQCVGFSDGLSKCERRVCRCTSIAYTKGIACVRKKMLLFNDEPVPVEASADTNSVVAPSS